MKIKATQPIPHMNSYCGFSRTDWERLEAGKAVDVETIPEAGKPYVEEVKKKAKDTNGN
jgi:hypothetical protein